MVRGIKSARQRLGLLLTGLLLAAGCSSPPPDPILINSAAAAPGGKVDLELPLDYSGFFEFDRWPKACGLLTDEDIRTVLPQAEVIGHRSEDSNKVVSGRYRNSNVTVRNAECVFVLELPGVQYNSEKPNRSGARIRLTIDGAGSEELITSMTPRARGPGQTEVHLGGATCVNELTSFRCSKGRVAFSLDDDDSWIWQGDAVRYQLGPHIYKFFKPPWDAPEEQRLDDFRRRAKFEADYIYAELVKIVGSKI